LEKQKGRCFDGHQDQQNGTLNFVKYLYMKNGALFENDCFKKGATWFCLCQPLKNGGSSPTS